MESAETTDPRSAGEPALRLRFRILACLVAWCVIVAPVLLGPNGIYEMEMPGLCSVQQKLDYHDKGVAALFFLVLRIGCIFGPMVILADAQLVDQPPRERRRRHLRPRPGRSEQENSMRYRLPVCLMVVVMQLMWIAPAGAQSVAKTDEPPIPSDQLRRFGVVAAPIDEPLITDRPDFTESTDAVPLGRFQIEMGYTFTYDREKGVRTRDHTAPEFLLRAGLAENFEFRLGWDGYSWSDVSFPSTTPAGRRIRQKDNDQGSNDVTLGFKYKFFEQDGWRPHFGIIGQISVPSGSATTTSGDVEPGAVLLWAYDVSDRLAIAGNVGVFAPLDEGERFVQTTASLSAAVSLTEKVGTYVEYFGLYPNADDVDAAHSLNAGLTYLVTNNFQLDWRIGFGINEEADDFYTGVGFAWRF